MAEKELRIKIVGDSKSAEQALEGVASKSGHLGKALKVGLAAASAGIAAFGYEMKQALDAAAQQEKAERMLAQAMQQHGTYTDQAFNSLKAYASELQRVTTFGDEATLSAMQQLQTYGMDIETMKRATKVAQDLAAAKGMDLTTAANLVGRAFAGNTSMLSRYGIVLDQSRLQAEGFNYVLETLNGQFGGAAQAAADTYEGRLEKMKNSFGDLQEAIGFAVLPAMSQLMDTLTELFTALQESGALSQILEPLTQAFNQLAPVLGDALQAIIDAITNSGIIPVIADIGVHLAQLFTDLTSTLVSSGLVDVLVQIGGLLAVTVLGAVEALMPAVQALAPVITRILQFAAGVLERLSPVLADIFTRLSEIIAEVLEKISPYLDEILNSVMAIIDAVLPLLPPLLDLAMPFIDLLLQLLPPIMQLVEWITKLAELIMGAFGSALEWIMGVIQKYGDIWRSVWGGAKAVWDGVWGGIQWAYDNIIRPIVDGLKTIWDGLKDAWNTAWRAAVNAIKPIVRGFLVVAKGAAKVIDILNPFGGDWAGAVDNAIKAVDSWHSGGYIPGVGDILLPMGVFRGGEFVIPREAAAALGPANLEALRRGVLPASGNVYHVHFHIPGFFGSQRELDDLARRLVSEHIPRVTFAAGGVK